MNGWKTQQGLFSTKIPPLALCPRFNYCKLYGYSGETELCPTLFLYSFLGMGQWLLLETMTGLHSCEYLKFICTLQITESETNSGQMGDLELRASAAAGASFKSDSTLKSDLAAMDHTIKVLNTSKDGDITKSLALGPSGWSVSL